MSQIYIVYVNGTPRCYEVNKLQAEKSMRNILQKEYMTEMENYLYHIEVLHEDTDDDQIFYKVFSVPKNSPTTYDRPVTSASIISLKPN